MSIIVGISNIILILIISYTSYLLMNHGIAHNAKGQQIRRFLFASICANLPIISMQASPFQPTILLVLLTSIAWMVAYPLTYHLTFRKSSPDYDNHMDIAFGIYLYGGLTGISCLPYASIPVGVLSFLLMMPPLFIFIYYGMYHTVIDERGIKLMQDTDYNEIIEFFHSYSKKIVAGIFTAVAIIAGFSIFLTYRFPVLCSNVTISTYTIAIGTTLFMLVYTWKPNHGIFIRTGIAQLWCNVAEYVRENKRYTNELEIRLKHLKVTPLFHDNQQPKTVILVIGESACRDYMSAFNDNINKHTTPWMEKMKDQKNFFFFDNAYSCDVQTVPVLEKALTEFNQYNGKRFYESCSIIDIAHKLGYKVHWYSNQGHLGTADTPITLVAGTADVAKWTKQELNKFQYDGNLLDFLHEVDPTKNNLVVLHCIGSHFNFENRFPESMRKWGQAGVADNEANYLNAIHYTDHVLERIFEYGRAHLNMDLMIYFSDHATVPNHRRTPKFLGYWDIRIPLMVWGSDRYFSEHPDRIKALRFNEKKYWTNDLLYELICGLMDVKSSNFDETASIASDQYRFTVDQLMAINGTIKILNTTHI